MVVSRRDQPLLLLAPLASPEHAQGEDGDAEDRRGAEAELHAQQTFAAPVDVAQIEQQRRLVEGEADAGAHRDRQALLDLVVVGQQRRGAGAEGEQDPRHEVVDVTAADLDVAEGADLLADAPGREADESEGAEEAAEQVEEDGFAARRLRVAADGDADGVGRGGWSRFQQRFGVVRLARAPCVHAAELAGDDGAGGTEGDRSEADRSSLRARPAGPARVKGDYFSSLMIVFTAAVVPSESWISTMKVPSSRSGCSSWTCFLSIRRSRASRRASTISFGPTEPNSFPSSPARWWIVRTVFPSSPAASVSRSRRASAARSAASIRRLASSSAPAVAGWASLRGIR